MLPVLYVIVLLIIGNVDHCHSPSDTGTDPAAERLRLCKAEGGRSLSGSTVCLHA